MVPSDWDLTLKCVCGHNFISYLRWSWVFFKSRLKNDVSRFGRSLFSTNFVEFDQEVQ